MKIRKNPDFKDEAFREGYLEAVREFSEQLDSYRDFAFENTSLTNEQVDALFKMEYDMQAWLSDHLDEVGARAEDVHDVTNGGH